MKNLQYYLVEVSGKLINPIRGKWSDFDARSVKGSKEDIELFKKEIFDLIDTAYSKVGGNAKYKKPEDLFSDREVDWFSGMDLHNSNDLDVIVFGKHTKYGIKFTGVGHDGSKEAIKAYIQSRMNLLAVPGYYVEVSDKIAEILISNGVNIVNDEEVVQKVLGKEVEWLEDGWYQRKIGGHLHKKIMLGLPKVK